jgi:LPXTG-motif cell wall-anchored protein
VTRLAPSPPGSRLLLGTLVAVVLGLCCGSAAGAAAGWSATPTSALPGTAVRVASDASTLCQWRQPAAEPGPPTTPTGPISVNAADRQAGDLGAERVPARGTPADGEDVFDGSEVELRLEGIGTVVALGAAPVTDGGAWSGAVTLPPTAVAGTYDLLARCVVDDPALDGVRSFDFDPIAFTVVEGPPPTTVTVPTELLPPITAVNPDVAGERAERPPPPAAAGAPTVASSSVPVRTLPNTGDGTLLVALSGIAALALGGLTLWYGTRAARRAGAPPASE